MRKSVLVILTVFLLFSGLSTFTFTETKLESSPSYTEVKVSKFFFREYVPLRPTFESLGYKVSWNDDMRMVEIVKDNDSVYIKPDENYLLVNGRLVKAEKKPIINRMRMQLPVETLPQIFMSVDKTSNKTLRISSSLKHLDTTLPKLKDYAEYEKLLSFYPEQFDVVYFTEGEEANFTTIDEAVVEEADVEMSQAKSSDLSETNNQVDGVDEADIVKQDENYIYALRNNSLQIIKTGRGQLAVRHTLEESGFYPSQLFIKDDKLILIGQEASTAVKTIEEGNRIITLPMHRTEALMVKIYEMKDLENESPKLIKSFGLEGHLLSARLVEDYVYVVANQYTHFNEPFMPTIMEGDGLDPVSRNDINIEDVSYFPGHVSNNILYTMGIDLNNLTLEGMDIDTYIGGGKTLYADKDTLYVAQNSNSGMWWGRWEDSTDVFSFDLNKGNISFKAKGSVPGSILNQFSMDEYDNHFRITTTRWGQSPKTKEHTSLNNLYILDQELKQVGSVEDLAPGERIYSTRMMGNKVYMVTYRQVDPFYVIDTSVPEMPQVLGYLKIPGYSSYLHPYDQTTIIGVGMETIDKGDRVVNDGVKISLFDVSDFKNPIEKDKVILGTGGSSSDVSYDHKAFLFNKEKNILAIPARINSGDYMDENQNAFIFSFTEAGMLNYRGRISHSGQAQNNKHYFNHDNNITRILYNGEDLYTLSNNNLFLNDFETLKQIEQLQR